MKLYMDVSADDIKTSFRNGREVIRNNLELKYLTSREYYNTKIVNDVIYNENTHIVSVFKDYLIFDDVSEFLKRQYDAAEAKKRLPKVIEFYETYSKVFPNYVNLPENKFMFKNIERKQLYWDSKQQFLMGQEERNAKKRARIEDFGGVQNAPSSFFNESMDDKMFTSSFIKRVDDMSTLLDNEPSFVKIVTIKDEYDSNILDLKDSKSKPNTAVEQLEKLLHKFTIKDTSSILTRNSMEISGLTTHLIDESLQKIKKEQSEISLFFKESKKASQLTTKINSKLHQYTEHQISSEPSHSLSKKYRQPNPSAIEIISNHYNDKTRKDKLQHMMYERSTQPSTMHKIQKPGYPIGYTTADGFNSQTFKVLRTTDSSSAGTLQKHNSPFKRVPVHPKLKITKSKESVLKKGQNQFKKQFIRNFTYSKLVNKGSKKLTRRK
jgi:hypothetical protein